MAQVVTDYKAFGIYTDEPVTVRATQLYYMTVTQAAADVTDDFANVAGTFWTAAAAANATGAGALAAITSIISKSLCRISWSSPQIQDNHTQVVVAPAAATEYRITTTSIVPSFAFFAANAPTAITFMLVTLLSGQERAVRAGSL